MFNDYSKRLNIMIPNDVNFALLTQNPNLYENKHF